MMTAIYFQKQGLILNRRGRRLRNRTLEKSTNNFPWSKGFVFLTLENFIFTKGSKTSSEIICPSTFGKRTAFERTGDIRKKTLLSGHIQYIALP